MTCSCCGTDRSWSVAVRGRTPGDSRSWRACRAAPSGGGPGLLGAKVARVEAREAEGRAIVTVERIAGRSGAVSVGYSTFAFPASEGSATAGADFAPVQGRLTWADGDDSEREIVVPLIADASGVEQPETFEVQLNDVQGGGLALDRATVNILGDAFPAGMFRIEARAAFREDEGSVLVIVHREDYRQGDVSVLVGVTGGTAQEGSDYRFPAPVRLTWRDGECGRQDRRYRPRERLQQGVPGNDRGFPVRRNRRRADRHDQISDRRHQ